MSEHKKCGWCGKIKEVYAYRESDYETVEHLSRNELLIEGRKPLKDDDVVGIPICRMCYAEVTGEEVKQKYRLLPKHVWKWTNRIRAKNLG